MSFESPRLNTSNTSLTAPVSQKKTTLFDYGFCKRNITKFQRSFSTSEATIKAAFEKGKIASLTVNIICVYPFKNKF